MTDIALGFDAASMAGDLTLSDGLLSTDDGLRTAIIISVFTDARARVDDEIPDGTTNRRGWWADRVAPASRAGTSQGGRKPDRIGSRMWLLSREKQVPAVLARAKEYLTEALQWLLDEGVATQVVVSTWVERTGVLGWKAEITRPDGTTETFRFDYVWRSL
jgi:phage gp46-like protein